MDFGDRLKLLRNEKNLTQQGIADILNVERPTIAGYETKRKQPDYEKVKILADYFNVSIDYLLGYSDIKNPYEDVEKPETTLTKKDEKDIQKALNETLEKLESSQDGLMFDGEPMDEATRELLRISLENSMRIAKEAAKKYTPKKYRK